MSIYNQFKKNVFARIFTAQQENSFMYSINPSSTPVPLIPHFCSLCILSAFLQRGTIKVNFIRKRNALNKRRKMFVPDKDHYLVRIMLYIYDVLYIYILQWIA